MYFAARTTGRIEEEITEYASIGEDWSAVCEQAMGIGFETWGGDGAEFFGG